MSNDDLADVLSNMGFGDPDEPLDAESQFYLEQTAGGAAKILNARYWLYSELAVYTSLAKYSHLQFYNIAMNNRFPATLQVIARELLRHYHYMHYHPRFHHSIEGRPRCDMDKYLDKVMQHEEIVKTIKQAQSELDSKL